MARPFGPINSGATTGGAGASAASFTTTTEVCGKVYAVYVKYNGSPPATTDVVVKSAGLNHPEITYLTLADANTDGLFLVREPVVDDAGAALASLAIAEPKPIADKVIVSVDDANDGDSVDIWLFLE